MAQKEAGLVLASRFYLFTGNYNEARRVAKRMAGAGVTGNAMSVFELEAYLVEQWSIVEEIALTWADSSDQRKALNAIDNTFKNNRGGDLQDADALMLWAKSRHLMGNLNDVLNVLNQVSSCNVIVESLIFIITKCCTVLLSLGNFYLSNIRTCFSRQSPHPRYCW